METNTLNASLIVENESGDSTIQAWFLNDKQVGLTGTFDGRPIEDFTFIPLQEGNPLDPPSFFIGEARVKGTSHPVVLPLSPSVFLTDIMLSSDSKENPFMIPVKPFPPLVNISYERGVLSGVSAQRVPLSNFFGRKSGIQSGLDVIEISVESFEKSEPLGKLMKDFEDVDQGFVIFQVFDSLADNDVSLEVGEPQMVLNSDTTRTSGTTTKRGTVTVVKDTSPPLIKLKIILAVFFVLPGISAFTSAYLVQKPLYNTYTATIVATVLAIIVDILILIYLFRDKTFMKWIQRW